MLKLKDFTLSIPVIQSPMAGCTDLAFRLVAREKGMGLAFLEMISSEALVRSNPKTLQMMAHPEEDQPLGIQLVGSEPDIMAEAACRVEDLGFKILDINCGCPVPKITSPGAGSALLREPEKSAKIFSKVVKAVKKIPVTVKMRKGYSDESGSEALRLAQSAQDAGCSAVTIHGRTRAQGYSGKADWAAIRKIKAALKIPVFGNGDVFQPGDALRMFQETGCDAVMIGRGGLGNPWIYKTIENLMTRQQVPEAPTLDELRLTALKHLELEIRYEGEVNGVLRFRKIAAWYFKEIPRSAKLRGQINTLRSASAIREAIANFCL